MASGDKGSAPEPIGYLIWAPSRLRPGLVATGALIAPSREWAEKDAARRNLYGLHGSTDWIVTPLRDERGDSAGGAMRGFRLWSDKTALPPSVLLAADAINGWLEDARADLAAIRAKLGVPDEPHQSLHERTLEAVDRLRAETPAPYQWTHWRHWPESVPPLDTPVLVWRPSWPYAILYRYIGGADGTEWADLEGRTTVTHSTLLPPTHWMPQPAPPGKSPAAERLTPFPPKPIFVTTPGGPDFSSLWRAQPERPDPVHVMPQLSRKEVWLRAWCAAAYSVDSTDAAARWADKCLAAFDERFGPGKVEGA